MGRSPCGPKIVIASTGPSTTPNQCGIQVENSTASPGLTVRSRSAQDQPQLTRQYVHPVLALVHRKFGRRDPPPGADPDSERMQAARRLPRQRPVGDSVMGVRTAFHPGSSASGVRNSSSVLTDSAAARRGRWSSASRRLPDSSLLSVDTSMLERRATSSSVRPFCMRSSRSRRRTRASTLSSDLCLHGKPAWRFDLARLQGGDTKVVWGGGAEPARRR